MTPISWLFIGLAIVLGVLYMMRRSSNKRARGR
jgi:hypothetical protein